MKIEITPQDLPILEAALSELAKRVNLLHADIGRQIQEAVIEQNADIGRQIQEAAITTDLEGGALR